MALVTEGFEITVTLADQGNNRSTLTFVCDPANVPDYATAQTARTSIVTALGNASYSEIVGTSLKEIQYENAIVYPTNGAQNETKASVTLQILGKNKKANIKIPAPIDGMFVGLAADAFNTIDVQDPILTAYVGNFFTAGYFTISDGEKIAQEPNANGVIAGKRISAKNNNG